MAQHGEARRWLALERTQFVVAIGQAAQGVVVDAQLRERGGNRRIATVEITFFGNQCRDFLTKAMGVVGFFGGKKEPTQQRNEANGDESAANLRQLIMVPMCFAGKLLAGRTDRQQMQEKQLAAVVFRQRAQLEFARRGVAIDDGEVWQAAFRASLFY